LSSDRLPIAICGYTKVINCFVAAGRCESIPSTAPRFARSRWPSLRSGHCPRWWS